MLYYQIAVFVLALLCAALTVFLVVSIRGRKRCEGERFRLQITVDRAQYYLAEKMWKVILTHIALEWKEVVSTLVPLGYHPHVLPNKNYELATDSRYREACHRVKLLEQQYSETSDLLSSLLERPLLPSLLNWEGESKKES